MYVSHLVLEETILQSFVPRVTTSTLEQQLVLLKITAVMCVKTTFHINSKYTKQYQNIKKMTGFKCSHISWTR